MSISSVFFAALLSSAFALPQVATAAAPSPRVTLPILFTRTISADRAHVGDAVHARTTQIVRLPGGQLIPPGTEVLGHVVNANAFFYDKTPYATQQESVLTIQFDSLRIAGQAAPLKVIVRAMADPLTSRGARLPKSSDLDSYSAVTQIGGDELVPSQDEVVNRDGDVVAYNRRNGVFAHLVANGGCDASTNEVSVGLYSASACGLYGFTGVLARDTGSATSPSTLSLVSTHTSPKVWRYSTALLELLPETGVAR